MPVTKKARCALGSMFVVVVIIGLYALGVVGGREQETVLDPLITRWISSLEKGNLSDLSSLYDLDRDVSMVESSGKASMGPVAVRESLSANVECTQSNKVRIEPKRLWVEGDLAACYFLLEMDTQSHMGLEMTAVVRMHGTWVVRRQGTKWRIAHEHWSVISNVVPAEVAAPLTTGFETRMGDLLFYDGDLPEGCHLRKFKSQPPFNAGDNPFLSRDRDFIRSFAGAFFSGKVDAERIEEALYSIYMEKNEIGVFAFKFGDEESSIEAQAVGKRRLRSETWRKGRVIVNFWWDAGASPDCVRAMRARICAAMEEKEKG